MQTSTSSIQTMPEATAPQQFTQLLCQLLSQYGSEQGEREDAGVASNSAPPLNIQKHLLALGQRNNPTVHIPQDSIQTHAPPRYPPLEKITKPNLTTAEAGYYLNRRPQTMRCWAMRDGIKGLRPKRIGGLLAWSTAEVKALAGVAQ
jgi:hypothetical protein